MLSALAVARHAKFHFDQTVTSRYIAEIVSQGDLLWAESDQIEKIFELREEVR